MKVSIYTADQNPHRDRSLGITHMTDSLLKGFRKFTNIEFYTISSTSSYKFNGQYKNTPYANGESNKSFFWPTDNHMMRVLTDNFHSLFYDFLPKSDIQFYPKGFLPLFPNTESKKVIIVHDVILQHYADQYPNERSRLNYMYWINQLKLSLKNADLVLTVSYSSKKNITEFCERHQINVPDIKIIYESSDVEYIKPDDCRKSQKEDYVLHLASAAPHKRTGHLLKWWKQLQHQNCDLPKLKLVGSIPDDSKPLVDSLKNVDLSPRINRKELLETIKKAKSLILPSEIEGFGLPALEAFYLGTPVNYVANTSVDEIINGYHHKGKFHLNDLDSFKNSLYHSINVNQEDALEIGQKLRSRYSIKNVVENVHTAFQRVLAPEGKYATI